MSCLLDTGKDGDLSPQVASANLASPHAKVFSSQFSYIQEGMWLALHAPGSLSLSLAQGDEVLWLVTFASYALLPWHKRTEHHDWQPHQEHMTSVCGVCLSVCVGGWYSKWDGGQLPDNAGKKNVGWIKREAIMADRRLSFTQKNWRIREGAGEGSSVSDFESLHFSTQSS